MAFTPLNIISSNSLLQSTISVKELVQVAKQRGYHELALTDNNVMYGAIDFYRQCLQAQIKPIIGLTAWLSSDYGLDDQYPLILIAKNFTGYQQLMKISTLLNTTEELVSFGDITADISQLILITPSIKSEFIGLLERGMHQEAEDLLRNYRSVTSQDNIKIGINLNQSIILRSTVLEIAKQHDLTTIALPEVEYLEADDQFATQVLKDIETGTVINHPEELDNLKGKNWLKSLDDYQTEFDQANLSFAVQSVEKMVDQIDLKIEFSTPELPKFKNNQNLSSIEYLKKLCEMTLSDYEKASQNQAYAKRLNYELSVINEMGFADYFLIIHDVVDYARKKDILMGPGRGSVAGSLVAYLLKITTIDPLEYGLLFERFLNPERKQMPDIDLDIPDWQRHIILEYVHKRYGHEHSAQIITFGTLAAKQAIRDVARVFGRSPLQINQYSKQVPNQNTDLQTAYQNSANFRKYVDENQLNRQIFNTAIKLEGLPRHYSTHAAGVVISDHNLVEQAPLQNGSEDMLMVQYSKNFVEEVGLLKMDFLGLKNLTILDEIIKLVQKKRPSFNIEKINLNDVETLNIFQTANTTGIFQFESRGIRSVLVKMHPTKFEQIVAVNALYRPGPMTNIDRFIARKNGKEHYSFPNTDLKRILDETFGILVYQEQVMEVASVMGGFSLGEADLLRRAMSKKNQLAIDQQKERFIAGAIKRGFSKQLAQQIYQYIESFANYGFNKSHAVAYSKLAFQLAYLKAHFSMEFYIALLNSVQGNNDKTKELLNELKRLNIHVHAPDINKSALNYQSIDNEIWMGLLSVKGVRRDAMQSILDERSSNGQFKSVENLLRRIPQKTLDIEGLQKLIYAGALDNFGYNRAELLQFVPELFQTFELSGGSMSLFEKLAPAVRRTADLPLEQKLTKEVEMLGTYVSAHPTQRFGDLVEHLHLKSVMDATAGDSLQLLLYIHSIRIIRTKKGEQMAFVQASDATGDIELVIFPRVFVQYQELKNGQIVLVQGKIEQRDDSLQMIVNQIKRPNEIKSNNLWQLKLPSRHNPADFQNKLNQIFRNNAGETPVQLVYLDTMQKRNLPSSFNLNERIETKNALIDLLQAPNVRLIKK